MKNANDTQRFSCLACAYRAADRGWEAKTVMLADREDPAPFLLVTFPEAGRLEKERGYRWCPRPEAA